MTEGIRDGVLIYSFILVFCRKIDTFALLFTYTMV